MNNKYYNDKKNNQESTPNQHAAKARTNLPYGFIPLSIQNLKPQTATDLDKNDPDSLYTGYINCSLYAMNELCVGNKHKDLGNDRVEIIPFTIEDRILISASTLKGCISNFLAAYLKLPISRMNDMRYSFRPNNAFSPNARIQNGVGLIEKIEADGSISIKKFKGNIFAYSRDLKKSGIYRYNSNKSRLKYHFDKYGDEEAYFVFYPYHDGIDGKGTLGKNFSPPSSHQSFGVKVKGEGAKPEFEEKTYTISAKTRELYKETQIKVLSNSTTGHFSDHPMSKKFKDSDMKYIMKNIKDSAELKVDDLIFFEYEKDSCEILTFGKHFRYRWAYSRSLHDFEEDFMAYDKEALAEGKLNIIEEMFGYSYEDKDIPYQFRSKSGKVHFSYAVHEEGTGEIKDIKWLPRPGSPKPSSYEFYLKQNKDLQKPMHTFGDPAREDFETRPRLSGRKMYYKTKYGTVPDMNPEDDNAIVKLRNVLHPGKNGYPTFKFKIHYENLTFQELNYLYFALCLGQNTAPDPHKPEENKDLLCHQIGYGKNYGMGAVKITIDSKNGKEDFFIVKHDPQENKFKPFYFKYKGTLSIAENQRDLFIVHEAARSYPNQGKDIHNWHTRLKNDDLKRRKEKG